MHALYVKCMHYVKCSAHWCLVKNNVFQPPITEECGWFFIFRLFKTILLIEFLILYISLSYKMLPCLFIIVFWLGSDRPSGLLFLSCPLYFFPYLSSYIPSSSVFFKFFYNFCCSHARVFVKTFLHEFTMSYSHTKWYLRFSRNEMFFNGRRVACQKLTIIRITSDYPQIYWTVVQ